MLMAGLANIAEHCTAQLISVSVPQEHHFTARFEHKKVVFRERSVQFRGFSQSVDGNSCALV